MMSCAASWRRAVPGMAAAAAGSGLDGVSMVSACMHQALHRCVGDEWGRWAAAGVLMVVA